MYSFKIMPNTESKPHVARFTWRCVIMNGQHETSIDLYDSNVARLAKQAAVLVILYNNKKA